MKSATHAAAAPADQTAICRAAYAAMATCREEAAKAKRAALLRGQGDTYAESAAEAWLYREARIYSWLTRNEA